MSVLPYFIVPLSCELFVQFYFMQKCKICRNVKDMGKMKMWGEIKINAIFHIKLEAFKLVKQ